MVSQLTNEDCKKAVIETIKDLNETESLISDHNSESDFSKFSEKIIRQKMTDIAYTFTNNHRSAFIKTMLYLNLEKTAKEFLTLKEELDNRQILNKVEETKIER